MIKLVLTDMDDTLIPAGQDGASDYAIEGIHAMQAAGLNVKVNTRLMADKARADALEARAEQLLAEFVPQADRVYQTVSNE